MRGSRFELCGFEIDSYLPPGSPGGGVKGKRCGRIILTPALKMNR